MTAERDSLETSQITQTGNALLAPAHALPVSTLQKFVCHVKLYQNKISFFLIILALMLVLMVVQIFKILIKYASHVNHHAKPVLEIPQLNVCPVLQINFSLRGIAWMLVLKEVYIFKKYI